MRHFSNTLLLLQLLPGAISYSQEAGTQFIYYDGIITGAFTTNDADSPSRCGDNGTYYFSNLTNSSLLVGVNPPWDSNPFFFEFAHSGNTVPDVTRRSYTNDKPSDKSSNISKRGIRRNYVGFTDDAVYNLEFASAFYVCEKYGALCGSFEEWPWYYVSAEMINLSAATVTRVNDVLKGGTDLGPFYEVKGDEKTWVSDGTVKDNRFDFQTPRNYSAIQGQNDCGEDDSYNWNLTTPFTYNINFTNTTSVALFTLSTSQGNITLSFSGTRLDSYQFGYEPYDNASYTAISLASPSNYSLPHFTFANGSEFAWHQYGDGSWDARVVQSSSRRELPTLGTLWCVVLGGIALVLFS